MFDLGIQGKIAIITGGSDGLGRATAVRLAAEGCKVAICARREEHLNMAAEAIMEETGGEVLAIPADVSKAADIDKLIEGTLRRFNGVDILINNAGKSAAASLEDVDDAAWQEDIDLKIMAAVRLCRRAIPIMRERGGGAIVNATIVAGQSPAGARLADQRQPRSRHQPHQIPGERICRGRYSGKHGVHRPDQKRPMGSARRQPRSGRALWRTVGERAARAYRRGGRICGLGGVPGL